MRVVQAKKERAGDRLIPQTPPALNQNSKEGNAEDDNSEREDRYMDAVFTVDLVSLLNRLNQVEQECKELRALIAKNDKQVYEAIEETKELIFDYAPKVKDENTLVFETDDGQGNTVYGHVIAEVRAEQ